MEGGGYEMGGGRGGEGFREGVFGVEFAVGCWAVLVEDGLGWEAEHVAYFYLTFRIKENAFLC